MVVKKLLSHKASSVEQIHIVGLCLLTSHFSVMWRPGTVPVERQKWEVVLIFKKGDWSVYNYLSSHCSASMGKLMPGL